MINGKINLADHQIIFTTNGDNTVTFSIYDMFNDKSDHKTVDQDKFFKALAIAVHNDGMPDFQADYPDAESIMGKIRWIP